MLIQGRETTFAQEIYKSSHFEIEIAGTSNLHDWTAMVTDFTSNVIFDSTIFTSITAKIKAEKIKSSEGRLMDSKMHDALKVNNNPTIEFTCRALPRSMTEYSNTLKTTGQLRIAGKMRNVELNSRYKKHENDIFEVYGILELQLTDFGIEPPTALFGALTTGNQISIKYAITYKKQTQL